MTRLLATALAGLSLLASGSAHSADMAFNFNQYKFGYTSPTTDSGTIALFPNTPFNPLLLPCDLSILTGEVTMVYEGPATGPRIWPRLEERLYLQNSATPISSTGYTPGGPTFDMKSGVLPVLMSPGSSEMMGFHIVNAVLAPHRESLFQPGDLPGNTLVRLELKVLATDSNGAVVADPDPSDNTQNFWLMRQCTCG